MLIKDRFVNGSEEVCRLNANRDIICDELLQEGHIATHVIQGHHRCTVSYERIISIVPFGTQGIHPYTGIGNEVRQLGQQRDEQFIRHRCATRTVVLIQDPFGFLSHLRHEGHDLVMQLGIEPNAILRIGYDLSITLQPIRYVRKRILPFVQ